MTLHGGGNPGATLQVADWLMTFPFWTMMVFVWISQNVASCTEMRYDVMPDARHFRSAASICAASTFLPELVPAAVVPAPTDAVTLATPVAWALVPVAALP